MMVVLPAPFGPMSPRISPWRTDRSTSSTARMPPKLTARPWVSSATGACSRRRARTSRSMSWARPPASVPCRNTARRTSGRSSSSAVGPSKRTSPFSMNTARSATVHATFTDCSTSTMVVPWAWMARTMPSSCSTITGARPRDSSSMSSSFGRAMKAWPSVSICCSPPDMLPARSSQRSRKIGKYSSTVSVARATCSGSWSKSQPASSMFSRTVSVGNTPLPPGTITMPSAVASSAGRFVMSRPSNTMAPADGSARPVTAFRNVEYPAPFVPRRATISPSSISRSTPKSTWVEPYFTSTPRATSSLASPRSRDRIASARARADARTRAMSAATKAPPEARIPEPRSRNGAITTKAEVKLRVSARWAIQKTRTNPGGAYTLPTENPSERTRGAVSKIPATAVAKTRRRVGGPSRGHSSRGIRRREPDVPGHPDGPGRRRSRGRSRGAPGRRLPRRPPRRCRGARRAAPAPAAARRGRAPGRPDRSRRRPARRCRGSSGRPRGRRPRARRGGSRCGGSRCGPRTGRARGGARCRPRRWRPARPGTRSRGPRAAAAARRAAPRPARWPAAASRAAAPRGALLVVLGATSSAPPAEQAVARSRAPTASPRRTGGPLRPRRSTIQRRSGRRERLRSAGSPTRACPCRPGCHPAGRAPARRGCSS